MKSRLFFAATALVLVTGATTAHAQTFTPQLTSTVGTGTEESFFTLDFQDGTANHDYAFGYKYDGIKTGADFLAALAANTPLQIGYVPGFAPGTGSYLGVAVNSFALDNHSEAGFANDYWSYWLGNDGVNWTYSGVGASSRNLTNGSWDGWSWDDGSNPDPNAAPAPVTPALVTPALVTPAAVPEASSLISSGLLLALGLCFVAVRRSRKPLA